MRSLLVKSVLVPFVLLAPIAVAGVAWWSAYDAYDSGLPPETMRAELTGMVMDRWSPEAAKRSGLSEDVWKDQMRSTFREADISNLELAASAIDYDGMNKALLGGGSAPVSTLGAKTFGSAGSDLVFTPITPCRIVDTRNAGGKIAANSVRSFVAHTYTDFMSQGGAGGDCGLPENVSALAVKLTASRPTLNGYLTVFPSQVAQPFASSLNYIAGIDTSNESHVMLCRPGCPTEFTVYSLRETDVVIDVTGYFMEPLATALDCVVSSASGNLDLLSGLQTRSVSCPVGYTATGGGCGGPLGIGISNSLPLNTGGTPNGWSCDLVGSLLSIVSYQVSATCCRIPGR
mgnify:CR=1 FL=1